MNIPAKQICDQIDTQVINLRKAIAEDNRTLIRETSAVIEAYCQLLKGPATKMEQPATEPLPAKAFQEQPMTISQPLVTPDTPENSSGEKRNLLDF